MLPFCRVQSFAIFGFFVAFLCEWNFCAKFVNSLGDNDKKLTDGEQKDISCLAAASAVCDIDVDRYRTGGMRP